MTAGARLEIGEHGDIWYRSHGDRVSARLRYRANDGRRKRLSATGSSKLAARKRLMASLGRALAQSGSGAYSRRTTLRELAEEWMVHVQELVLSGRRSPSTLALYRQVLDAQILPSLGDLRLVDLTVPRLDAFIREQRRAKGYATAKLCRSVLSGVCGWGVRREALRSNPVRDVAALEREGASEARALSMDEAVEWLAILDGDAFAVRKDLPDLVRFILGTGCRLGETVGACWGDVDFELGLLHVRRTVIRVAGVGLVAKAPKTTSGVRTLRLPNSVVQMLRARRPGDLAEGPIFPDSRGGYRDRNNVEKDFRKVRAGTKFEWVVPHTYRKTVAHLA